VTALAAVVASLALPFGAFWSTIAPAGGKLLVSGHAGRGPGCVFLRVDPRTLRLAHSHGSCSRTGQLTPDVRPNARSQWQKVFVAGRLAFSYNDGSDTRPQWADGGGSLWLYDVATTSGAQLLRYSLRTGQLQQRLHFPVRLFRPVLAANADGAWLMAATNGGVSGQATAALYHVAPGAQTPAVLQRGARGALWMTVSAHTLWLETVTRYSTFTLWRYDGPHGRRVWRLHRIVVGNASYSSGALWGTTPGCNGKRHVQAVRLDAATGARKVIGSVPLSDCEEPTPGLYYRGVFWVVVGQTLYRIKPS
jgi:hypothetical protein